ncbi:MAG TPA: 50S ribosomal protein L32 [Dehalococcoidia bacterium]
MAPLPKKKYPSSRQGKRRSHIHLATVTAVACPQCHAPRLSHHACPTCGYYKGREAVAIEKPALNG